MSEKYRNKLLYEGDAHNDYNNSVGLSIPTKGSVEKAEHKVTVVAICPITCSSPEVLSTQVQSQKRRVAGFLAIG